MSTPRQDEILARLRGEGSDRWTVPDDYATNLRAELEADLAPLRPLISNPIWVGKSKLDYVHQCERLAVEQDKAGFADNAAATVGTVVHRALSSRWGMREQLSPAGLVDRAIDQIAKDQKGPAQFLAELGDAELAEIRGESTNQVTHYLDTFPELLRDIWRPRVEATLKAELADGAIQLSGRPDLAIGQPNGKTAGTLIIEFKTGRFSPRYIDELRFYALLETLRCGVPPFRIAAISLASGDIQTEDIADAVLRATARRLVDGIEKLVNLAAGDQPTETPGSQCHFCPASDNCLTGKRWLAGGEADDYDLYLLRK